MIKQEIEILIEIEDHDNIIKLEGAYEDMNSVHLVFEYIEGGDLFDLIKTSKCGALEENEAKRMFYQIILCIQYLHSSHIIHRDIKPENLVLDLKGITNFNFSYKYITINRIC
jgi:serine/threonine protein kinase